MIPVIEQLTQDFSTHRIQPVVSPHRCGANLKVSNLIAGRYLRDDTLPRFFWLLPINDGLGLRTEARTWSRRGMLWPLPCLLIWQEAQEGRCVHRPSYPMKTITKDI